MRAPTVTYCIALYDYEGEGDQELTFEEGEVIRVLDRCAHGVDDGWWTGEIDGRVGNFPSLVAEECDEFGEPLECEWDETPPGSAPPVFTPPGAPPPGFVLDETEINGGTAPPPPPGFKLDDGEIIVTSGQLDDTELIVTARGAPPPGFKLDDMEIVTGRESVPASAPNEAKQNEINKEMTENNKKFGFAMELSQEQQDKYGSQFQKDGLPAGEYLDFKIILEL